MKIEDRIQQEIVQWFRNNHCLKHHQPCCAIFSVPNGGSRNKIEAMTLKATGMMAGVSDLIVVIPGKVLFVEVKTPKGYASDEQKEFLNTIDCLGHTTAIVRSLKEFQKLIDEVQRPK